MADANTSPTLQARSALRKAGTSTTLPRNFAPLSLDGDNEPRTPDQTFAELSLPPPPAHSTYRIRRPRVDWDHFSARNRILPATLFASDLAVPSSPVASQCFRALPTLTFDSDQVVPSIETPTTDHRPMFSRGLSEPLSATLLSVPGAQDQTPRTPLAQTTIVSTPEVKRNAWELPRGTSMCSVQSDSSLSSAETYATRPTSFDGSVTSPECDHRDPFSPQLVNIIPDTPTRRRKKMRMAHLNRDPVDWNTDMDNHLFNMYQMYLADPTVTPFKTVPGSVPPTGVCHRVARRARETWPRASRVDVPIVKRYKVRNFLDVRRTVKEKTPELTDFLHTDHHVGGNVSDGRATWPSERATRRRLKQLCKEKFTITAHYQRLRQSRSPSPFSDHFARQSTPLRAGSPSPAPEHPDRAGSYTTRELGISLVAGDASAPLARLLTTEEPPVPTGSSTATPVYTSASASTALPASASSQSGDDWFSTPVSKPSDPMQMSTPVGPSLQPDRLAAPVVAANIPRLASPFNYSTWNAPGSRGHQHRRHISHGQFDTIHATGSRLLSPFRPEPEISFGLNKRRASRNPDEEATAAGSSLASTSDHMAIDGGLHSSVFQSSADPNQELVFTGAGDISHRRVRLRNRGATMAATGQERIQRLFTPSTMPSSDASVAPTLPKLFPHPLESVAEPGSADRLAVPPSDSTQKRLGSPFELDPNKRSLRSRSPRHVPSFSDPFISTDHFGIRSDISSVVTISATNDIGTIGERLALFKSLHRDDETPR